MRRCRRNLTFNSRVNKRDPQILRKNPTEIKDIGRQKKQRYNPLKRPKVKAKQSKKTKITRKNDTVQAKQHDETTHNTNNNNTKKTHTQDGSKRGKKKTKTLPLLSGLLIRGRTLQKKTPGTKGGV